MKKDNIESLSGQTLFVGIDVHKCLSRNNLIIFWVIFYNSIHHGNFLFVWWDLLKSLFQFYFFMTESTKRIE